MTNHIIFDVDGTLWDSTGVVAKAWNRAIAEVGGTSAVMTPAVLKKEFGKTMDVIADDLFPDADGQTKEQLVQRCRLYEQDVLSATTDSLLFPSVRETLRALSGRCLLYIVSNCQSGYIEMFMEKAGVEAYITDFECFGDTGMGKAENIRLLMERNHLKDAVYVGDTQGDYEATAAAGIPFIFAKYGFGNVEKPFLTIDKIDDLLNLF